MEKSQDYNYPYKRKAEKDQKMYFFPTDFTYSKLLNYFVNKSIATCNDDV